MMQSSVLQGVKVLDFGRFVAAPCCAAILGDMGADVIRVERVEGGEDRWLGPVTQDGIGGMFLQNNRNKRSMTLDPFSPEGSEIVKKLVQTADVVVANLPEKMLVTMGLSYDQLQAIKPDIILTSVTAYGTGGPYSDRLGFDAVGQVMSGAVSRSGWPDQPVRTTVPYVDFSTALASALGTLAALMYRNSTGQGQRVETSLLSTALMMTSAMMIEQSVLKTDRTAALNRGQLSAPNNIYTTKDGWLLAQVVGQPIFKRWAALMGREEWLSDPRFADDKLRGEHWEILDQCMADWCALRCREDALQELEDARIPAYPVNSIQDALDDPHIAAMGYLKPTDYPGLPSPAPIAEAPLRLSKAKLEAGIRAPTLGEHTDQIMLSLGYGAEDIARLRERRVI